MDVRHIRAALLGLAAVLAASVAHAQNPPAKPEAPAVSPRSLELARRYVEVIHLEATFQKMMQTLIPNMVEQMSNSMPNITAEQRKAISEATVEASPVMMHKLIERAIPIYAEVYTEQELSSIVDFYSTPAGQAMVDKAPLVTAKLAPSMKEVMPDFQAEMLARLCRKIDCGTAVKQNRSPRPS